MNLSAVVEKCLTWGWEVPDLGLGSASSLGRERSRASDLGQQLNGYCRWMAQLLTPVEAFEAMRSFLAQFNEREPPDARGSLNLLLGWTELDANGATSDPAQWFDWEGSILDARQRLSTIQDGQ